MPEGSRREPRGAEGGRRAPAGTAHSALLRGPWRSNDLIFTPRRARQSLLGPKYAPQPDPSSLPGPARACPSSRDNKIIWGDHYARLITSGKTTVANGLYGNIHIYLGETNLSGTLRSFQVNPSVWSIAKINFDPVKNFEEAEEYLIYARLMGRKVANPVINGNSKLLRTRR